MAKKVSQHGLSEAKRILEDLNKLSSEQKDLINRVLNTDSSGKEIWPRPFSFMQWGNYDYFIENLEAVIARMEKESTRVIRAREKASRGI